MHVRRLLAAALCASALAACSGDPEPLIADPSPTPVVSDSPTAPATPEPWEEKTEDGAVAFVKHWLEAFNHMQVTGETDAFRALGTSDCAACDSFVNVTNDLYDKGATVESEGWALADWGFPDDQKIPDQVIARIHQSAETITYPEGGKPDTNPAGNVTVLAKLRWAGSRWQMQNLEFPS